jgi:hypothetical protein
MSTLQEEAEIFHQALIDFFQLVAKELYITRIMDYMTKMFKQKQ